MVKIYDDCVYITVSEAADAAGITKQAAYQKLNRDWSKFYQEIDGQKMLKKEVLDTINPRNKAIESKFDPPLEQYYQDLINQLKENNQQLNKEITEQKRVILEKDAIILNYTERLDCLAEHFPDHIERKQENGEKSLAITGQSQQPHAMSDIQNIEFAKMAVEKQTTTNDKSKNNGPDELRHRKYNIFDENGALTFRYNMNVFPPNNCPIGTRTYPVIKIAVVTQGEADWRFKNTVYRVRTRDIVLLRPNHLRSIEKVYPGCSMKCEMYEFLPLFLKSNINCLHTFYMESDGTNDIIPAGSPGSDRLLSLFSDIRKEVLNPNDMSGEIIRGYLIVALAIIDRMMSSAGVRNSVTITNTNSDPIYDREENSSEKSDKQISSSGYHAFDMAYITNFIDEHLSDEINVDDLAKAIHMSRSHFYKIFRQYNGISVNQYILQCRIKNTVQLLLTNEGNILEAAYQSGFTSSSGFYKAFKQIMGVTPKEYLRFIRGS